MSELSRLKKENKRLKTLLKNAVDILNRYKDILQHPERLGLNAKKPASKRKKTRTAKAA